MEPEETVGIKTRSVLWWLTFFGFAMNYIIRINVNIAIVDMISSEFKGKNIVMSECIGFVNATNVTFYEVSEGEQHEAVVYEKTYISLERRLLDFIGVCGKRLSENHGIIYGFCLFCRLNMKKTDSNGTRRHKTKC